MPYRALMWSVVTVGLALLAVGMWARAVEPMVAGVQATTQGAGGGAGGVGGGGVGGASGAVTIGGRGGTGDQVKQMGMLVRGTLMLAFVLICVLLVVGFFGTLREWMKFRGGTVRGQSGKTKYVDAWKIAGERMKEEEEGSEGPGSGG